MSIFYGDNGPAEKINIDVWKMDGTKAYLKHYENYMMLDFIAKSSRDREEVRRAQKELSMCEKKLAWWRRHPKFDDSDALKGVGRIKAMWEKR